ncbi:pentatricopeptide repeat-containing protein At1g08070, chloroplastic-like [Selaginella moellendorffii]|uniref:pentatricopeptide repeat-containing protein At1g08070, chloroplastic-like n=1 Tax=Selaginella moellendorffii TaxID=88036 RepID=UPI000D1CFF0B|nr:pentatricopeptide repeat-containing protein At1g08070, chloroplastic-like [Selaginella moellendorffii]|eukprot:XP_024524570.1 pentatricopeptide repeat-containing protein At1g08070, chloroplastic-like [Selaginella moellendorffii]
MYSQVWGLEEARHVFERIARPSIVSWNCIILGHALSGEGELAFEFYSRMQHEDCEPDRVTLLAALMACSCWAENEEVDLCGSLEDARRVFEAVRHKDAVLWTAIILGYAQGGEGEVALGLYSRMQGILPDRVTFLAALKACSCIVDEANNNMLIDCQPAKLWSLKRGREIHAQARGIKLDQAATNTLLDMYVRCGSMDEARQAFEAMEFCDVFSWTCLGYAHTGEGNLALELFQGMQDEGCEPDAVTFVAAFKACSILAEKEEGELVDGTVVKLQALERGRALHSQSGRKNKTNIFVANALLDLYAKCGSMVEAWKSLRAWLRTGRGVRASTEPLCENATRQRRVCNEPSDTSRSLEGVLYSGREGRERRRR